MAKLLIVEDDSELAGKIKAWLQFDKFTVDVAPNGADARQFLETYMYDAVILDWQLPDCTGLDICREFRARGGMVPVLFLTGRDGIEDKEQGFGSGADDYLTKPFHLKELTARLKALLRRTPALNNKVMRLKHVSLETGTFRVTNDGEEIKLLPKEYALLEFLLKRPDQVFSTRDLLDAVWESDSEASEDTIRTYIKTLHKKITSISGDCPIKTIHGQGYKIDSSHPA